MLIKHRVHFKSQAWYNLAYQMHWHSWNCRAQKPISSSACLIYLWGKTISFDYKAMTQWAVQAQCTTDILWNCDLPAQISNHVQLGGIWSSIYKIWLDLLFIKCILKEWSFEFSSEKKKNKPTKNNQWRRKYFVSLSSDTLPQMWPIFLRFHTSWFSSNSTVKTSNKTKSKQKIPHPILQKKKIMK